MTRILFYEKPGCVNNTRQKAVLRALGHEVVARDLLHTPWSAERLAPFFQGKHVPAWFNPSAPRIKSGEVVPALLDPVRALQLMIEDPLLIRRPLIETEFGVTAGFEEDEVLRRLGVRLEPDVDLQTCVRDPMAGACAPGGESP